MCSAVYSQCCTINIRVAESFTEDINPTVLDRHQLTTMEKSEDVEQNKAGRGLRGLTDPYEDKTPREVLTRQYLLSKYALDGTVITYIFPMAQLLSLTTIKKYLSVFRFLRCGVELDFQFVCSPMQYGLVGIGFVPYTNGTSDWVSDAQLSQSNMELLDISEQTSYKLNLPYLRPELYYDLLDSSDTRSWRVCVKIFTIGTITTGAPNTIQMAVFGRLTDVSTAGYLPDPPASFQSASDPIDTAARIFKVGKKVWDIGSNIPEVQECVAGPKECFAKMSDIYEGWNADPNVKELSRQLKEPGISFGVPDSNKDEGNAARNHQAKAAPQRTVKLDVVGDVATPGAMDMSTTIRLGDNIVPRRDSWFPSYENIYELRQICMKPVYVAGYTLGTTTDVRVINCTPFPANSHAKYISKMFKFYRGGSRVLLKFCTSQMVSARVKITLFTAGGDTDNDAVMGNVKTWVKSIRGSTSWALDIPYLQKYAWQNVNSPTLTPTLHVQLLDPLPQPYDKAISIYFALFQSASDDIKFCGLQSCYPALAAAFQATVDDEMLAAERLGGTQPFSYQGGIDTIGQILTRYSTRTTGEVTVITPQPLQLDGTTPYDNFDYISNMYKFWCGGTHIKTIFSAAPADGILEYTLLNSNSAVGGDSFAGGNGIALTHQAVWPTIEATYPYMCINEFNSIWATEETAMPEITFDSTGTVISKIFIAAAPDFNLMYLMPVPDFSLSSRVEFEIEPRTPVLRMLREKSRLRRKQGSLVRVEEPAVFQSGIPRFSSRLIITGIEHLTTAAPSIAVDLSALSGWIDPSGTSYQVTVSAAASPAGTYSDTSFVRISNNLSASFSVPDPPAIITSKFTLYAVADENDSGGKYVTQSTSVVDSSTFDHYITFQAASAGSSLPSNGLFVPWTLIISPQDSLVHSTNYNIPTNTEGYNTISGITTVDISGLPVPVTISGGSLPISGTVQVEGISNPTNPVWTTLYNSS